MGASALSVLVFLLQAPEAPQGPPAEPPPEAVVELTTGGRLEGSIVLETADYVQLRLDSRAVVGFARSKVASIQRRQRRTAPAPREPVLMPRDEWFVLHDAEGRVIGRMHGTTFPDDEGRLRVGEEWEFRERHESTAITVLELVNQDLTPVSAFFHERQTRNADGRVVRECLVQGVARDGEFVVDTKGTRTPARVCYPLDGELRLPLSLLQSLRQDAGRAAEESHVVFDARTQEFVRRSFSSRRRTVRWRDEVVRVREMVHGDGQRRNSEWIDASSRTLRREVNGPSLVAIPVAAEMTERYLASTEPVFPPTVAVESDSEFAIWLPNPAWQAVDAAGDGRILVQDDLHQASACLVAFDHLGVDVLVDSAADAVQRWLGQASAAELTARERVEVRGREAVRLLGTYVARCRGGHRPFRSEVYVFRADRRYMALCFAAPAQGFEELRQDFERMLESVDLYPLPAPE